MKKKKSVLKHFAKSLRGELTSIKSNMKGSYAPKRHR